MLAAEPLLNRGQGTEVEGWDQRQWKLHEERRESDAPRPSR